MFNKLKQLIEDSLSDNSLCEGQQTPKRLANLAATALLLEVSHADHCMDEEETSTILNIVRDVFEIAESDITEFFSEAEQRKHDSTSLYEFTGVINASFSESQKYNLVRQLWCVAYADGKLDRYEDHTIRKVAELIYVSHSDFIKAKLEVSAGQNS